MNENPTTQAKKHILFSLKLAAVMIGAGLLLSLARKQGWINGELVERAIGVIIGLALAAFGNAMPKMLYGPPPRSLHHATLAQAAVRVGGWTMALAFLAWAALWAFAPRDLILIGSLAIVGASATIILGYAMWKYVAGRASGSD